jgi:arabinoxylan arabinofuranohydrolase
LIARVDFFKFDNHLKIKNMITNFSGPNGRSLTGSSKLHKNKKEVNIIIHMKEIFRTYRFVLLMVLFPTAVQGQIITPEYLFNSDPTLHVIDNKLYMVVSHDQTSEKFIKGNLWDDMYDFHVMSTTDFVTWRDYGSIFGSTDFKWSTGHALWDGDAAIPANGRFYAYAPIDGLNGQVGVFVADKPEGPYKDALGHPLSKVSEANSVSPSVYMEGTTPYLIWGWSKAYIAKLKPDMLGLAEAPVEILSGASSDFVESPYLIKIDSTYYLSYSNGGLWGERGLRAPEIWYRVSKSIYGPYTNPRVLLTKQINPTGQGYLHTFGSSAHQGFAKYNNQWYLAYHLDSKDGFHRRVCITRLTVNSDGSLKTIDPNNDPGVTGKPVNFILDAFAPYKREAEEFHERSNADEEYGIKQDFHFKMKDSGYLLFKNMDFGTGAKGFKVEVSCEIQSIKDGKIEFRLDDLNGEKIGESRVNYTKGITNYVILSGPVSNAKGIHNLYIIAHGKDGDAEGHLFNINWFTFTK